MKQLSSTNVVVSSLHLIRGALCATILAVYLVATLTSGFLIGFLFRLLGLPVATMDLGDAWAGLEKAYSHVFRVAGLTNHGGQA